MKVGKRATQISATMLALTLTPTLSGCGSSEPAPEKSVVIAEVDASGSGVNANYYFTEFAEAIEARQGQALQVKVIAIGRSTDPAEVCSPVEGDAVPDPGAEDPQASWKRGARELLAKAKPLFECAQSADVDGSAIAGYEHARGADQLWVFSDGMFNDPDLALKSSRLGDPEYVQKVTASQPTGNALTGVEVYFYGVGVNAGLSNSEVSGLRTILQSSVQSQGGLVGGMETS